MKLNEGNLPSLADEKDAELPQDLVHDDRYLRSSICKMSVITGNNHFIHGIPSGTTVLRYVVEDHRIYSLNFAFECSLLLLCLYCFKYIY